MPSSDHPEPGVPSGTDHDQLPSPSGSPKAPQPQSSPPSSTPVDAQNTNPSHVDNDPAQNDNTVAETQNTNATTGGESTMPAASVPSDSKDVTHESHIESADQDTAAPPAEKVSEESETKEMEDSGPSLVITLLLITGARHPFKIDGKYLKKRGVNVENHDPFSMSVYTLKELIWREWRAGKFLRSSCDRRMRRCGWLDISIANVGMCA